MTSLVKDDATFVVLIRVALEDPDIRRSLITILSLAEPERTSLLRTLLQEAQLKQLPQDFIDAISNLLSEDVSQATLEVLRQEIERKSCQSKRLAPVTFLCAIAVGLICVGGLGWLLLFPSANSPSELPPQPKKTGGISSSEREIRIRFALED